MSPPPVQVIEIDGNTRCAVGATWYGGESVNYTLIDVPDSKYPYTPSIEPILQGNCGRWFYEDQVGCCITTDDGGKGAIYIQGYNLSMLMAVSFVKLPEDMETTTLKEHFTSQGLNGITPLKIKGTYIIDD